MPYNVAIAQQLEVVVDLNYAPLAAGLKEQDELVEAATRKQYQAIVLRGDDRPAQEAARRVTAEYERIARTTVTTRLTADATGVTNATKQATQAIEQQKTGARTAQRQLLRDAQDAGRTLIQQAQADARELAKTDVDAARARIQQARETSLQLKRDAEDRGRALVDAERQSNAALRASDADAIRQKNAADRQARADQVKADRDANAARLSNDRETNAARVSAEREADKMIAGIRREVSQQAASDAKASRDSLYYSPRTGGQKTRDTINAASNVALVGGAADIGALASTFGTASQYDQGLRNVNSLVKLSDSGFRNLHDQILALTKDPLVRQGPVDLVNGFYNIVSAGKSGAEALDILRYAAVAAGAGMTDTATSTRAGLAVLNSGISGVKNAKEAYDVLFQEVNLGVNTFPEIANAIGDVLPIASKAGITFQEVSAAIALMTRSGQTAGQSTTQLTQFLIHLIGATGQSAKEMDALGIKHGLTAVRAEGLTGALNNVIDATKNHQDSLQRLFPRVESFSGLLALSAGNGQKYQEMLNGMTDASKGVGASQAAAAEQMKGAQAQTEKLRQRYEQLQIEIGEKLLPTAGKFESDLGHILDLFNRLPAPVQQGAVDIAAYGGATMIAVGAAGKLYLGLKWLIETFPKVGAAAVEAEAVEAGALAEGAAAIGVLSPWGLAITAAIGLIGGIAWAWHNAGVAQDEYAKKRAALHDFVNTGDTRTNINNQATLNEQHATLERAGLARKQQELKWLQTGNLPPGQHVSFDNDYLPSSNADAIAHKKKEIAAEEAHIAALGADAAALHVSAGTLSATANARLNYQQAIINSTNEEKANADRARRLRGVIALSSQTRRVGNTTYNPHADDITKTLDSLGIRGGLDEARSQLAALETRNNALKRDRATNERAAAALQKQEAQETKSGPAGMGGLSRGVTRWSPLINQYAAQYGVDPRLVASVMQQESGGNPNSHSGAGASGLMQIMPGKQGVTNAFDPIQNLNAGVRELASDLRKYHGSIPLALAAYNAGPGNVDKYHGVPPFAETQHYVKTIMALYGRGGGASTSASAAPTTTHVAAAGSGQLPDPLLYQAAQTRAFNATHDSRQDALHKIEITYAAEVKAARGNAQLIALAEQEKAGALQKWHQSEEKENERHAKQQQAAYDKAHKPEIDLRKQLAITNAQIRDVQSGSTKSGLQTFEQQHAGAPHALIVEAFNAEQTRKALTTTKEAVDAGLKRVNEAYQTGLDRLALLKLPKETRELVSELGGVRVWNAMKPPQQAAALSQFKQQKQNDTQATQTETNTTTLADFTASQNDRLAAAQADVLGNDREGQWQKALASSTKLNAAIVAGGQDAIEARAAFDKAFDAEKVDRMKKALDDFNDSMGHDIEAQKLALSGATQQQIGWQEYLGSNKDLAERIKNDAVAGAAAFQQFNERYDLGKLVEFNQQLGEANRQFLEASARTPGAAWDAAHKTVNGAGQLIDPYSQSDMQKLKDLDEATRKATAFKDRMKDIGSGIAGVLDPAFESLLNGSKFTFGSVVKDFKSMIVKMIAEAEAAKISSFVMGGLGNILGGLFGGTGKSGGKGKGTTTPDATGGVLPNFGGGSSGAGFNSVLSGGNTSDATPVYVVGVAAGVGLGGGGIGAAASGFNIAGTVAGVASIFGKRGASPVSDPGMSAGLGNGGGVSFGGGGQGPITTALTGIASIGTAIGGRTGDAVGKYAGIAAGITSLFEKKKKGGGAGGGGQATPVYIVGAAPGVFGQQAGGKKKGGGFLGALMGAVEGFATGGPAGAVMGGIEGYNSGGIIPGGGPDVDSKLAKVTTGEAVLSRPMLAGTAPLPNLPILHQQGISEEKLAGAIVSAMATAGVNNHVEATQINHIYGSPQTINDNWENSIKQRLG